MTIKGSLAILCVELLIAPIPKVLAQHQTPPTQQIPEGAPQGPPQPMLTPDQLDSLVAPIALYPDPILSQVLVTSTYPLEIVEAARWLGQNSSLQGQALVDAAAQQPWDASVQALVIFPDLLKRLNQNITWTSDLGNTFLAQQEGVMGAVQRMRQRAQSNGALESTKEQQVTTTTQGGNTYIEIQPASPQVVYVPEYNPVAVWGPPAYYPYPPIYYPPVPSTGASIAATAISFGAGVAVGAIWSGGWGGWGWGYGWGRNNVVINNNFINRNHFTRVNVANGNNWVHNPAHRAGVPYNNRNLANRFNGAPANFNARPTPAQIQQHLGNVTQRPGNMPRPGPGNLGQAGHALQPGQGNLGPGGNAYRPGQGNPGMRPGSGQVGPGNFGPPGGGDRVGNRIVGGGAFNANRGGAAFGGMNLGGNRARVSSSRGFASGGGLRGGGRRR